VGYNYTKGNATQQIAVRSEMGYSASRWTLTTSLNSYSTIIDTIVSRRSDAHVDLKYFLTGDWFTMGHIDWLRSDEQQLDLRTTGIIGLGGYFLRTQTILCYLVSGAAFNHEIFREGIGTFRSWEGFGKLSLDVFGAQKMSLISSLWTFPSISEQKRLRLVYHIDLKWAFMKDLNAKLGYTFNYDNRPPDGASRSDYVISFTLGWEI
jgi:putative salt-induced outer membrane protein YdiY